MTAGRGFNALDLQRAQWDKIQKRIDQDAELKKRWESIVAEAIVAERNLQRLQETLRAKFRDHAGDAMTLLRRGAERVVDGRTAFPELIQNPDARRIQGNEIEDRQRAG